MSDEAGGTRRLPRARDADDAAAAAAERVTMEIERLVVRGLIGAGPFRSSPAGSRPPSSPILPAAQKVAKGSSAEKAVAAEAEMTWVIAMLEAKVVLITMT